MAQRPSKQLTGLQLVKKFPTFYGTRSLHSRIYNRPPPVPILNQIIKFMPHPPY